LGLRGFLSLLEVGVRLLALNLVGWSDYELLLGHLDAFGAGVLGCLDGLLTSGF
jgi:hypothetical protein